MKPHPFSNIPLAMKRSFLFAACGLAVHSMGQAQPTLTETTNAPVAGLTGFQGDIAFAVLVQDGGFGGAVAAPIAARFLTTLAG